MQWITSSTDNTRVTRDVAYLCFLPSGIATLVGAVASVVPADTGTAGGIGLLVLVPLYLAAFAALPVGLVLTVRHREPGLVALGVASLVWIAVFLTEPGPVALRNTVPLIYGLVVVALQLRWWRFARRRWPG